MIFHDTSTLKQIQHDIIKSLNTDLKPYLKSGTYMDMNKLYQYFIEDHQYPYGPKRFEILLLVYLNRQELTYIKKEPPVIRIIDNL